MKPVASTDLDAMGARAYLLVSRAQIRRFADEYIVREVGFPSEGRVLSLVNIDPGERSAEVIYMHTPTSELSSSKPWLRVSMLLDPPRVLTTTSIRALDPTPRLVAQVEGIASVEAKAKQDQAASLPFCDSLVEYDGQREVVRVYCLPTLDESPVIDAAVPVSKGRRDRNDAPVLKIIDLDLAAASTSEVRLPPGEELSPVIVAWAWMRYVDGSTREVLIRSDHGTWMANIDRKSVKRVNAHE